MSVPHKNPVSLGGREFQVDYTKAPRRRSLEMIKNQADTRGVLGEQSLSADELWRRSQRSWHKGAGQTNFDDPESDAARFRASQGVDVWTKNQLSLLNATTMIRDTTTRPYLTTAGARLYVAEGNQLHWTTDASSYTAITMPGEILQSMASDGYNVYLALGIDGLYYTNTVDNVAGLFADSAGANVSLVRYVNGRLMIAVGPSIYNITDPAGSVLPTVTWTHDSAEFDWVDFAEGSTHLYAAGTVGDKSTIYKITIEPSGTDLGIPTQAAPTFVGEQITAIYGYAGYLLIGTSRGLRLAAIDSAGNLTFGPLISTSQPVRSFLANGQYVYYAWSNFASGITGLGRLDLTMFPDPASPLKPAYASDLMTPGGSTFDIVMFGQTVTFAVDSAVYRLDGSQYVSSGYVESGLITYELTDEKIAEAVDTTHVPKPSDAGAGTYVVSMSTDGGTYAAVGASVSNNGTRRATRTIESTGTTHEIKHTITRGAGAFDGVTLTGWTLRSEPIPQRGERFLVPLVIRETYEHEGSDPEPRDCAADVAFIIALVEARATTTFIEGTVSHTVRVADYDFIYEEQTSDDARTYFQGVMVVTLKKQT